MAAPAARPTQPERREAEIRTLRPAPRPSPKPSVRDWSNVVFSVAFCEEARRAYEARAAG